MPLFSTDPVAARLLEDEIERRDLWREYATVLIRTVAPGAEEATKTLWYVGPIDIWYIVRATPEQRARAFLAVVQERSIGVRHTS